PLHDAPEIVVADRGERAPDALPRLLLDPGDRLPTRAVDHLAYHGVREQPGRGGSGRLVRGWRIARLPVRLRERLPRDDGPGEPLPAEHRGQPLAPSRRRRLLVGRGPGPGLGHRPYPAG